MSNVTLNELVGLVLKARGQSRDDHVHVESAEKLVKESPLYQATQQPSEPTPPVEPPTPPVSLPETPEQPPVVSLPEDTPPAPGRPTEPETAPNDAFYNPLDQVDQYVGQYPEFKVLAETPNFKWFNGDKDVWATARKLVTEAAGKRVGIILYAIPGRDNGNYSAGGLNSKDAYYSYVGALADAIGDAPVTVIIEPDALGLSTELTEQSKKQDRYDMLASAIDNLGKLKNTEVFLDASMWHSPDRQKQLLDKIWNFDKADGTALNTSGYEDNAKCIQYAKDMYKLTGKKSGIDTSRNGNGAWSNPNNEKDPWCNPPGREIGVLPTTKTGVMEVAYYWWAKAPGESDGNLRGPAAGQFSVDLARDLVNGK